MNKIPTLIATVFLGCADKTPTITRDQAARILDVDPDEVVVVRVRSHGFESGNPTVRYVK